MVRISTIDFASARTTFAKKVSGIDKNFRALTFGHFFEDFAVLVLANKETSGKTLTGGMSWGRVLLTAEQRSDKPVSVVMKKKIELTTIRGSAERLISESSSVDISLTR